MKGFIKKLFLFTLVCSFAFGIFSFSAEAQSVNQIPRKIVVFQENFVNETAQTVLLRNFGAIIIKPLRLISGMAVYLPPQAERALLARGEVLRIDDDLVINAIGKPPKQEPPPQPAQELPWGINRIGADKAWLKSTGLTIKVAVLDTGIDLDHLDLQGNIKGNVNMINPRKSGNDDNGHGSHVAGIVAAINNDIGVIGAGPEIYLYAVKALDRNGSGWLSDLIEGLEWCINNKMQVVNMSLGSSADNQSFHDAIIKTYQAGVTQVAAAGNNGESDGAISYPAKYPETIAVSAIDENNGFASFSSYGQEIDLAAPGVNINSAYNNGYYKILNGTSMAAPHVTGTVALVISAKGIMSPDDIKAHLKNTSEFLIGLSSYQQGAGLVRADLAVQ